MRKLFFGSLLLCLLGAGLVGCKKEKIQIQSESRSDQFVFIDKSGNEVSSSVVDNNKDGSVIFVSQVDGINYARYFENEEEAYQYLTTQPQMKDALKKLEFVRTIRALAEQTGDINKENYEDFSDEMKALLSSYKSPIQAKGVGVLWDYLNASGSTCPLLAAPQPTLFSFNNKAESATGIGLANWLWDKRWFRGTSVYLLMGTASVLPFDGLGFRNRAESAI